MSDVGGDQQSIVESEPSWVSVTLWWTVTIVVLVVLDDLTFGPFFWFLSRTVGPAVAVGAVYTVYVPFQIYLVHRATLPDPGRLAAFFLRRLHLARRSQGVARREAQIHRRVVGAGSAIALSLVIGGVLPLLLLQRLGFRRRFLLRLSVVTATVYATEFALLHGLLPSLF